MDKQLEKHIRDFIYDKLEYDNVKILNIEEYNNNPFFGESLHITYISDISKKYPPISIYIATKKGLNEFISLKRNDKILNILK